MRILFLGTPGIVIPVLAGLLKEHNVIGVVTQPHKPTTKKHAETVYEFATARHYNVLTPDSVKELSFLDAVRHLAPDLCVTAAYGNWLPQAFLDIPKFGTLNVHPSLLPRWRGAAPVQRCLEANDTTTGVSIVVTVKSMDAGPIVSQLTFPVGINATSGEMLRDLFALGAQQLIACIPKFVENVLDVHQQQECGVTHASKLDPAQGLLSASMTAQEIHDRVRAFDPWPGTRALWRWDGQMQEVKIIQTRMVLDCDAFERSDPQKSLLAESGISCFLDKSPNNLGIGTPFLPQLRFTQVQSPGKRVMSAVDFWNGLRNKSLDWFSPLNVC